MIKKNKHVITIVILFATICLWGLCADYNFIRFKLYDDVNVNYNFSESERNDVQLAYSVVFPLKNQTIDLNGLFRNVFGQREMNGVVKLDNGHIIIPEARWSDSEIDYCAKQIIELSDYCHANGVEFLYIQPPVNIDEYDKELPIGIEDYRNENIDSVMQLLDDADVDVIDLRQCMREDGMSFYDYVYKTDHHWNTRAAFYGFQHIATWIDVKTGKKADPMYLDFNNYNIIRYKNWHIGATGQRVGRYFAGADDYELITPKFNTSLTGADGNTYTFDEYVVGNAFDNRDLTSKYTYDSAYNNTWWRNNEGTTECGILMFSDSYSYPLSPYMKLAYSGYEYSYWQEGINLDLVKGKDVVIFMPYIYNANSLKVIPATE